MYLEISANAMGQFDLVLFSQSYPSVRQLVHVNVINPDIQIQDNLDVPDTQNRNNRANITVSGISVVDLETVRVDLNVQIATFAKAGNPWMIFRADCYDANWHRINTLYVQVNASAPGETFKTFWNLPVDTAWIIFRH